MKRINNILKTGIFISVLFLFSCKNLTELNINPNGVNPEAVNPIFLLTDVQTELAKAYLALGFQDIFAGVMQMAQKDAFSSGFNDYDLSDGDVSWSNLYAMMRNNELAKERAEETGNQFALGVALVLKSYGFGLIADLWGDAPYSKALNGAKGDTENVQPEYDTQQDIYHGILADLKTAAGIFEQNPGGGGSWDIFYDGDASKWVKFANSLQLRYYMRISEKEDVKSDFAAIANSGKIFEDNSDDVTMDFPGTSEDLSWPNNTTFDKANSNSDFNRIKLAKTFRDTLEKFNDPRLGIWFAKVQIPIVIEHPPYQHTNKDTVDNGVRYIHDNNPIVANPSDYDTDPDYVGIPTSRSSEPYGYNLNPSPNQSTSLNPHVSYLNDIYREPDGPLLKARLISNAEVQFLLAEAAQKGWISGSAEGYYKAGIKASFDTWGASDDYNAYVAQPGIVYDGTLGQIMFEKWISSWTMATESWLDWRRTGLPDLKTGPHAKRNRIMLRYFYASDELNQNADNVQVAISHLEQTNFSGPEGVNSAWSKPWVIQGTGKPW